MVLLNARGDYLIGPELPLSTRKKTKIPNEQRRARPPASMQAAKDIVLNAHPSAHARSLSSLYNCVGMVFASRRTCVEPEHLPMILADDEYQQVNRRDLQPGDIVVYRDDRDEISHVGIVADVTPNPKDATWDVVVLSQWGGDGEYFHLDYDVNPRLGRPTEYWTDRT